MPQCKKDGCREPALPTGKRYCEAHKAAYLARRQEYEERRRTMAECESGISPDCNGVLSHSREKVCANCERVIEELNVQAARDARKRQSFDDAVTVEELKDWIREYLL